MLICDLAEVYHIYDYKGYSPKLVSTLIFGLREDSRVKMLFQDTKINLNQKLMARMVDELSFIRWSRTKDASSGINRPKSILQALIGNTDEEKPDSYSSGAEFDSAWKRLNGG